MLSHNKITIIDEVIRRTLFLVEDGKTKADLNTLITNMKSMQLFGQVLGMVVAFHPAAECYTLRLVDQQSFICPELYLQSGCAAAGGSLEARRRIPTHSTRAPGLCAESESPPCRASLEYLKPRGGASPQAPSPPAPRPK